MKKNHLLLIIFSLHLLLFPGTGSGALTVNPATSSSGETVTATVSGNLPGGAISISFQIDFGDGSPIVTSPNFTTAGNNSFSATHRYVQAGNYTITATTFLYCCSNTTSSGNRNAEYHRYRHHWRPSPGHSRRGVRFTIFPQHSTTRGNRYRIIRGSLPPGLKMDRKGNIMGIPEKKGAFSFTVQVANSQGAAVPQDLTLLVDPGMLVIQVTPEMIETTRGGGTTQTSHFFSAFSCSADQRDNSFNPRRICGRRPGSWICQRSTEYQPEHNPAVGFRNNQNSQQCLARSPECGDQQDHLSQNIQGPELDARLRNDHNQYAYRCRRGTEDHQDEGFLRAE